MSSVACLKYFLNRHVDRFQFPKTTVKTGDHLAVVLAFCLLHRSHACHHLPMTGNHHGLPALDPAKQFGETSLGFGSLNPVHIILPGQCSRLEFSINSP